MTNNISLGKINHIAIATKNITSASEFYHQTLGATLSAEQSLPEHGVNVVFVELGETKIELLEPLGENSPIEKFLEKNPDGGLHHVCYEVSDIIAARDKLLKDGIRILGDGEPQTGAHGNLVLFLHPKDSGGVLIELEEIVA